LKKWLDVAVQFAEKGTCTVSVKEILTTPEVQF
jgi:hypothetical protein